MLTEETAGAIGYVAGKKACSMLGITQGGGTYDQLQAKGIDCIKEPVGANGKHVWWFNREQIESLANERLAVRAASGSAVSRADLVDIERRLAALEHDVYGDK